MLCTLMSPSFQDDLKQEAGLPSVDQGPISCKNEPALLVEIQAHLWESLPPVHQCSLGYVIETPTEAWQERLLAWHVALLLPVFGQTRRSPARYLVWRSIRRRQGLTYNRWRPKQMRCRHLWNRNLRSYPLPTGRARGLEGNLHPRGEQTRGRF